VQIAIESLSSKTGVRVTPHLSCDLVATNTPATRQTTYTMLKHASNRRFSTPKLQSSPKTRLSILQCPVPGGEDALVHPKWPKKSSRSYLQMKKWMTLRWWCAGYDFESWERCLYEAMSQGDLEDDGRLKSEIMSIPTDWNDPSTKSHVIYEGKPTDVTSHLKVKRVELLESVPSLWPVPRSQLPIL